MLSLYATFWFDLCLFFVSAGCVLYFWCRHKFNYWKKKGVPGPKPSFPFGSIKQMALGNKHFGEVIGQIYEESKQYPFAGAYLLHRPALVVNDLDLIKTILVKDFVHFTDHGVKFDHKWEPIRAGLFHVTGKDWKRLRAKLTPAFTVSKVRGMFDTIASCGTAMQKFLDTEAAVGGTIDAKDVMGKFTSDVIVSVAFGIDSNSFASSPAAFKQMGSLVFDLDLRKRLSQFLSFFAPNVQRVLGFRLVDKKVSDFFGETIEATVKFREENNVKRKDIMHCLIQLKNNQSIEEVTEGSHHSKEEDTTLTMSELSAQAFGFFVAGYETSSTLLSFTMYEMARHPDLQKLLHRELDQILYKYNGEITYEGLKEMTYMLQIIHEALRLYPTLPIVFRICTKQYVVPGTDVVIEKDTPVIIPTWGIQKDPAIYPNPLEFDPTRFAPENKAARHPYSLLSFGEGPRICIARKVAMLQIQIALVSVFRYYKVSTIDDSPIEISKKTFFVTPKDGIKIKIEKRF